MNQPTTRGSLIPEGTMSIPRRRATSVLVDLGEVLSPISDSIVAPSQRVPLFDKSPLESDPTRYRADLTSNFYKLPFTTLSVGPVLGTHQAKFYRAARESKTRYLVEGVSSLLDPGVSAFDLSVEDFTWLLYFIRAVHYTKVQLMHRGVCTNYKHLAAVSAGTKPENSLETISVLTKTNLKETVLDVAKIEEYLASVDTSFLDNDGWVLHFPTMRDLVEMEEDFSELPSYSEIEYMADFACIRRADGTPTTLRERIEYVEQLSSDQLSIIIGYKNLVCDHGVVETIKFTCKECGAVQETEVSITAHSFL